MPSASAGDTTSYSIERVECRPSTSKAAVRSRLNVVQRFHSGRNASQANVAMNVAKAREHFWRAAFDRAVVEHGDPRVERRECRRVGRIYATVMRDQVYINRSNEIVRAREREQWPPAEIADVEESELSELQTDAGRARILMRLLRC